MARSDRIEMVGMRYVPQEYPEDIAAFLSARAVEGESASTTLRRLLGIPSSNQTQFNELQDYLKSFAFLTSRTLTKRYLGVLGVLYSQDRETFTSQVGKMSLGRRVYFARSPEKIEESGTSAQARRIPGSPFWALTNISSAQKEEIVGAALNGLKHRPLTKTWVCREMKRNLKERKKRAAKKA